MLCVTPILSINISVPSFDKEKVLAVTNIFQALLSYNS